MKIYFYISSAIFFYSLCIFPQNIERADSILFDLESQEYSKKEQAIKYALVAINHPNLKKALQAAHTSLKIATEIKKPILKAEALEEISLLERELGNNLKSLNASLKALYIYESLNLKDRLAASFDQVGVNYVYNEDYKSAITYFKKAIQLYNKDLLSQIATINNLGEAYRNINYLDSAKIYFKESLQKNTIKNKDIDYLHLKGYSLGNLGMVYAAEDNLKLAEIYLKQAVSILQDFEDAYSTATYTASLGQVYYKLKKNNLAKQKLIKSLEIAQEAGLKEQIRDINKMLVLLYESQEKYEEAFFYQKRFQVYQDSLLNIDNIKKIEQLKAEYEIDKREHKISLLNQLNSNQKKWVFSLTIGFFTLAFLSYLLTRSQKKIKQINIKLSAQKEIISKREQEKTLLLSELNHRVKNNLQMISSLLSLQSNQLTGHPAQQAIISGQERVEALSLVHRKLYQDGINTRIYIKEYISELVLGLFYSYDAKFKPKLNISNVSVNVDIAIPLALILNEIIINALKYAYTNIKHPVLKIKIHKKNPDILLISIKDNGIGFKEETINTSNTLGLKIINSLIIQLNGSIKKINSNGTIWKMKIKTS